MKILLIDHDSNLCEKISKYFNFIFIRYYINRLHIITDQYDSIFEQIIEELYSNENIITNNFIGEFYLNIEKIERPQIHLLNLIRNWIETYDIIIINKNENNLISFMKNNLIEYEIIDGNESERFEKAKKIIGYKLI